MTAWAGLTEWTSRISKTMKGMWMRKIPVAANDRLKNQSVRVAPSALNDFETCTY